MVQFEVHLPVKIARSISLLLCCFKQRAVITLLCDLLSHSNLSAMSLKLCLSLLLFYDVSPIGSYSFLSIHSNNHTLILPILYYELFATNLQTLRIFVGLLAALIDIFYFEFYSIFITALHFLISMLGFSLFVTALFMEYFGMAFYFPILTSKYTFNFSSSSNVYRDEFKSQYFKYSLIY